MRSLYERVGQYKDSLVAEKDTLFRGKLVCKLKGVTFDSRQEALSKVTKDTKLRLERERNNRHDFFAVGVHALIEGEWKSVGYIPKETNKIICYTLDCGVNLSVSCHERLGDPSNGYSYGLMVEVKR